MNPIGPHFHLGRAQKCLEFAVHLTPQYGDSFLELLRLRFFLEIQTRLLSDPLASGFLETRQHGTASSAPQSSSASAISAFVANRVHKSILEDIESDTFEFSDASHVKAALSVASASSLTGAPNLQLSHLEVSCAYADPNYGFLWFWCRNSPLSTPREVLQRMRKEVTSDLTAGASLWAYVSAIIKHTFDLRTADMTALDQIGSSLREQAAQKVRHTSHQVHQPVPTSAGNVDAHDGGLTGGDFAVGSMRLSRSFVSSTTVLEQDERRRLIFGSDILCV